MSRPIHPPRNVQECIDSVVREELMRFHKYYKRTATATFVAPGVAFVAPPVPVD